MNTGDLRYVAGDLYVSGTVTQGRGGGLNGVTTVTSSTPAKLDAAPTSGDVVLSAANLLGFPGGVLDYSATQNGYTKFDCVVTAAGVPYFCIQTYTGADAHPPGDAASAAFWKLFGSGGGPTDGQLIFPAGVLAYSATATAYNQFDCVTVSGVPYFCIQSYTGAADLHPPATSPLFWSVFGSGSGPSAGTLIFPGGNLDYSASATGYSVFDCVTASGVPYFCLQTYTGANAHPPGAAGSETFWSTFGSGSSGTVPLPVTLFGGAGLPPAPGTYCTLAPQSGFTSVKLSTTDATPATLLALEPSTTYQFIGQFDVAMTANGIFTSAAVAPVINLYLTSEEVAPDGQFPTAACICIATYTRNDVVGNSVTTGGVSTLTLSIPISCILTTGTAATPVLSLGMFQSVGNTPAVFMSSVKLTASQLSGSLSYIKYPAAPAAQAASVPLLQSAALRSVEAAPRPALKVSGGAPRPGLKVGPKASAVGK